MYVARLFSLATIPFVFAIGLFYTLVPLLIERYPIKCWKLLKMKCKGDEIIIEDHFQRGTIKQLNKREKRQRYMGLLSIILIPIIGYAILCFIMQLSKAMDVGASYGIDGLMNVLSVWLNWIGGVDPSVKYCGYELRLIHDVSSSLISLGFAIYCSILGVMNLIYWKKYNYFPKCWALLKSKDIDKNCHKTVIV